MATKGLSTLTSVGVDLLMEKLGIAQYLEDDPCGRTFPPYSTAVDGWASGEKFQEPTKFIKAMKLVLKMPLFREQFVFKIHLNITHH